MSIAIISPEFSALNFNNKSRCLCGENTVYALPVYKDFAARGQISIAGTPKLVSEKLYIAIASASDGACNCGCENIAKNPKFDTDLSEWTPDDFVWKNGSASYEWTELCYLATLRQQIAHKKGYFKTRIVYKADTDFDIVVGIYDDSTLLDSYTIEAIADGRWHEAWAYVGVTTEATENLTFKYTAKSVTRGSDTVYGPCNDTGQALTGFAFNEIQIFKTDTCETVLDEEIELIPVCSDYRFDGVDAEEAPVPEDAPFALCSLEEFSETELYPNGKFDTNPFSPVTSEDLSFNLAFDGDGEIPYDSYFTLYIASKVYVFRFVEVVDSDPYSVVTEGNLKVIDINTAIDLVGTHVSPTSVAGRLQTALSEIVDIEHATTSTVDGTFPHMITIADIPAGSFLDDTSSSILANITTVGASVPGIYLINGFYDPAAKNITYRALSGSGAVAMILQTTVDLQINKKYSIKYGYITSDAFALIFRITDSSPATVHESIIPSPLPVSTAETQRSESFICTADDTYRFTFTYTPDDADYDLTIDNISVIEQIRVNVTWSNDAEGYIPVPTGYYTKEELYAAISEILGIEFGCLFNSCCVMPLIEFTYTYVDEEIEYTYTLNRYWSTARFDFPELLMEGTIAVGKCFRYAILDSDSNVIVCSNLFRRAMEECYSTMVEYWSDEDGFGFRYPSDVCANMVRLPFYLHGLDYPTAEKIYRESTGKYRRISTVIEKEYEAEVDRIPEWLHDVIVIALKHDHVLLTDSRIDMFREEVSQQGKYDPDWKRTTELKAKAKFKVRKKFNGTNNNCKSNNTCS